MNRASWLSPYWLSTGAFGHFPDIVTVQAPTETIGDHGGITIGFADLPGHVNLPAMVVAMQAVSEMKGVPATIAIRTYQGIIIGAFLEITDKCRIFWHDRYFDILNVMVAPKNAFTHFIMREVS